MINAIKMVFSDILLLYKNILHWNFSKIIIYIYSLIIASLSILPFIFIYLFYTFFTGFSFTDFVLSIFSQNPSVSIFGNVLLIIISLVFPIFYIYGYALLFNLNLKYIDGKKLPYLKNEYLNIKLLFKFISTVIILSSIIIIPFIIFILLSLLVVLFSGGIEQTLSIVYSDNLNMISITLFIILLSTIVSVVYLLFRFGFSIFFLIDKDYKILKSFKKSFKKTKGFKKPLYVFVNMLIVFLIIFPISFLGKYLNTSYYNLSSYNSYVSLTQDQKNSLSNESYYNSLEIKFSGMSQKNVDSQLLKLNIYNNIYSIIIFLFYFGFLPMFFTSLYRRIIAS